MRAGFSLLEVVLSSTLLMLTVMLLFGAFRFGFDGFRSASGRSDLQAEARSILVRLKQDVELSTLVGTSLDSSAVRQANVSLLSGTSVQPRRLLCLPNLSDWNNTGQFDPDTGLPRWDGYVLYHAGLDSEGGLWRLRASCAGGQGQSWSDLTTYQSTYLGAPPAPGTSVAGAVFSTSRKLTTHLLAFDASKSSKTLTFTVRLRGVTGRTAQGGSPRDEIYELQGRFRPKNLAL